MTLYRLYLAVAFCVFGLCPQIHSQTLISAKPPAYPLAAKAAGIEGTVVVKGTLTKEGKMQDIRAVSGPPELRRAAIDAVQNWSYKPYRHFGRIVEVNTTITVNFNMGTAEKKAVEQAKAQAELAHSIETPPAEDNPQPAQPRN